MDGLVSNEENIVHQKKLNNSEKSDIPIKQRLRNSSKSQFFPELDE